MDKKINENTKGHHDKAPGQTGSANNPAPPDTEDQLPIRSREDPGSLSEEACDQSREETGTERDADTSANAKCSKGQIEGNKDLGDKGQRAPFSAKPKHCRSIDSRSRWQNRIFPPPQSNERSSDSRARWQKRLVSLTHDLEEKNIKTPHENGKPTNSFRVEDLGLATIKNEACTTKAFIDSKGGQGKIQADEDELWRHLFVANLQIPEQKSYIYSLPSIAVQMQCQPCAEHELDAKCVGCGVKICSECVYGSCRQQALKAF